MTTVDSLLTDALRDRYVIERELDHGGMATVYLAHDLKQDRPKALKVLHSELAALVPERKLHYFEVDSEGNSTTPNPLFGRPVLFQPPMSARLGLSLDFGVSE